MGKCHLLTCCKCRSVLMPFTHNCKSGTYQSVLGTRPRDLEGDLIRERLVSPSVRWDPAAHLHQQPTEKHPDQRLHARPAASLNPHKPSVLLRMHPTSQRTDSHRQCLTIGIIRRWLTPREYGVVSRMSTRLQNSGSEVLRCHVSLLLPLVKTAPSSGDGGYDIYLIMVI